MPAVLCVTEITSWGILFYAFPVLATEISSTKGSPTTWVIAAFSAGQVVAALTGIPVGRWLDARGRRSVMTAGSVPAVPAVVAVAPAQNLLWFTVAWLLGRLRRPAPLVRPAARVRPDRAAHRPPALAGHLTDPRRRAAARHHPGAPVGPARTLAARRSATQRPSGAQRPRLVVATVLRLAIHSRGLTALPHKDELQREG